MCCPQGIWRAPLIANPNYKGKWTPRRIPNPHYFKDDLPYRMTPIVSTTTAYKGDDENRPSHTSSSSQALSPKL